MNAVYFNDFVSEIRPSRKLLTAIRSFHKLDAEIIVHLDTHEIKQRLLSASDIKLGQYVYKNASYAISWVSLPEECFAAGSCELSFRGIGKYKYVTIVAR